MTEKLQIGQRLYLRQDGLLSIFRYGLEFGVIITPNETTTQTRVRCNRNAYFYEDKVYLNPGDYLIPTKNILTEREKVKAKGKIRWSNTTTPTPVKYFKDLELGEYFVIDTPQSKGAVYRKILIDKHTISSNFNAYAMLELHESTVFQATSSPIKIVEDVELYIPLAKPSLYN